MIISRYETEGMNGTSVSSQRFACESLHAAFPLVRHLFDVAEEWTAPAPRKAAQIPPRQARKALCSFEGSPCAPFESPEALLRHMRQATWPRRLRALSLGRNALLDTLISSLGRGRGWEVHNGSSVARGETYQTYQVVLLQKAVVSHGGGGTGSAPARISVNSLRRVVEVHSPVLVLVVADSEEERTGWLTDDGTSAASPLDSAQPAGYEWSFFPGTATEAIAETAILAAAAAEKAISKLHRKVRRRGRARARGVRIARAHQVAALWRKEWHGASGVAHRCNAPLYSLERRAGVIHADELAAAEGALAHGIRFSEWFACGVLEPLAPLVRNLLVAPRRKGKSVWAACFEGKARAPPRVPSPCFWVCGEHYRGEQFVDQVLSSPHVLLERLSRLCASARRASAAIAAAAPLLVLDPAAGEGNYTQHLPDGMGRLPVWQLVTKLGWHAKLAEPAPPTFERLRLNFRQGRGRLPTEVTLRQLGLKDEVKGARNASDQMWVLEANVPELGAKPLPSVTRQRLQWASSIDTALPKSFRRDLWQIDHLAGGPLREALASTNASAAAAFAACVQTQRQSACFRTTLRPYSTRLGSWDEVLLSLGVTESTAVDLLVLDLHGASIDSYLRAFPIDRIKPTFIYYRHPKDRNRASSALRSYLLRHGYSTSAHWETAAWGELNLAWRSDRCDQAGMPGKPLWWARATDRSALPVLNIKRARHVGTKQGGNRIS